MAFGPVNKYPGETRDLPSINWTLVIGGNTITSSEWVSTSGLSIEADDFTPTSTIVRVSGGTESQTYTLRNTVIWSDGQIRIAEITVTILTDPLS